MTESEDGEEIESLRFLTGFSRNLICNAPTIVLLITLLFFILPEITADSVQGITDLVESSQVTISGIQPAVIAVTLVCLLLLIYVLLGSGIIDIRDVMISTFSFSIVAILVLGTAVSVSLVVSSNDPTELEPNIIYVSGYLLMLLITGWYTRDSMQFTEELLDNLYERVYVSDRDDGSPSSDEIKLKNDERKRYYNRFIKELNDDLRCELPFRDSHNSWSIRASHLFGVAIVLPAAMVWWFGTGPQNLGQPSQSLTAGITYIGNVLIDFLIAIVAFHFLVLIKYLHELTAGSYPVNGKELILEYDLGEPDSCAGLSGLGELAMRVNLLLIIAGLYLVYRLYVQGLRALPSGGLESFFSQPVPNEWFISYIGPFVLYIAIIIGWLNYSFLQLHRKMRDDRDAALERWPDIPEGNRVAHIKFPDGSDPYSAVYDAPVWPIDDKQLLPLLLANIAPVAVVLVDGLQLI